jgi:hypothetical protein
MSSDGARRVLARLVWWTGVVVVEMMERRCWHADTTAVMCSI